MKNKEISEERKKYLNKLKIEKFSVKFSLKIIVVNKIKC